MENVWTYIRTNKLAIYVFDSTDDLLDACCKAWNFFASDKPHVESITTREWAKQVTD